MIYTIDEIQKRVMPAIQKYHISEIYLFGSYARNEATERSDIDFAIDTHSLQGLWQLSALREDIKSAFDCPVDILTLASMKQEKDNPLKKDFLHQFMKERVRLYE